MSAGLFAAIVLPIILYVVVTIIALLLLYGVVRVAVARGMRDYHKWAEKQQPASSGRRSATRDDYPPITPPRP